MTETTIFLFGVLVTVMCGGAIGLLLWAACEDGKYQRERVGNKRNFQTHQSGGWVLADPADAQDR